MRLERCKRGHNTQALGSRDGRGTCRACKALWHEQRYGEPYEYLANPAREARRQHQGWYWQGRGNALRQAKAHEVKVQQLLALEQQLGWSVGYEPVEWNTRDNYRDGHGMMCPVHHTCWGFDPGGVAESDQCVLCKRRVSDRLPDGGPKGRWRAAGVAG